MRGRYFATNCRINPEEPMDGILMTMRITMPPTERRPFMDRYLRQIEVSIE